jgi:hypothetical protein
VPELLFIITNCAFEKAPTWLYSRVITVDELLELSAYVPDVTTTPVLILKTLGFVEVIDVGAALILTGGYIGASAKLVDTELPQA